MTNPVQVTPDDREAAALFMYECDPLLGAACMRGSVELALRQAFARHRHARITRIAELEAAVTRLTLALEMERGRGQPRAEVAGYAPPTRTYERFLEAIHEHSPNGELVVVRHHPNGDWSVLADLTAQVRAAYDSSIAATRTYQQGIEDAAKAANAFRCPLDRTADNTAYLIVDAIRALGTKERLLYRTALGTKP